MGKMSEIVWGQIPVVAALRVGSERLRLFLTDTRIIVAHLDKAGARALSTTFFFGEASGRQLDPAKTKHPTARAALENLKPQDILAAHKDNFSIRYEEVVSVGVREVRGLTQMVILTADDKFEVSTSLRVNDVIELLAANLGTRVEVVRSGK